MIYTYWACVYVSMMNSFFRVDLSQWSNFVQFALCLQQVGGINLQIQLVQCFIIITMTIMEHSWSWCSHCPCSFTAKNVVNRNICMHATCFGDGSPKTSAVNKIIRRNSVRDRNVAERIFSGIYFNFGAILAFLAKVSSL